VTEVLDYLTEKELLRWMLRTSPAKREKIQDDALRVGKEVDFLVHEDIKKRSYLPASGDEELKNCIKGWELFKKDYPFFVESVKEMQIELMVDEVIGHPDFVIGTDLRWGIVDLKCALSIHPGHWTQAAKYFEMKDMMEHFNRPGFIGILRLDKKTGLYEYKEITDQDYIRYEVEVFDAYLVAYNHAMKNREQIRAQLEEELLNATSYSSIRPAR